MLIYLQMLDNPKDRAGFETVYYTYRQYMYRRAYNILKNEQDAEDAVHEAFIAIAKNFEKISAPKCHKTKKYIVTIIESKAIDIYRKKQRQPHIGLIEAADAVHEDVHTDNSLGACLLKLPEKYRTVLLLKYDQGLSNREIARALNTTQANVRKIEQRAKAQLEKLCQEEGLL